MHRAEALRLLTKAEHRGQQPVLGSGGALRMGMIHGAYCVGCCWFLMLLLFVGGVMNLAWIVGLALLVLLEKTMPAGQWLARAVGLILLLAGGWAMRRSQGSATPISSLP